MNATARKLGDAQSRTHWSEPKRCRSLSLSDTAWGLLTKLAAFNETNRSEVLERLLREAAKANEVEVANLNLNR
jgi:hypothetical protein